ncbi:MAG: Mur ligase family protein, partial [Patescibacteria group bacterium]
MNKIISTYLEKKFQNKKVLIIGLGREGLSTYKFLKKYLPQQRIDTTDEKPLEKLSPEFQELFHKLKQDSFHNFREASDLENSDFVFLSPGVPESKYSKIINHTSQITSNTQLFFDITGKLRSAGSEITTIGVTGTKGKSTTTALIHHVLKENGFDAYLGGNIGIPPLDLLSSPLIKEETPDANQAEVFFVLELSSHQLVTLKTSPDIAVIQTIKEEHLDHFESFEKYISAKANITKYQSKKDLLVYFEKNKIVKKIAEKSKAEKIAFSKNNFIKLEETKLKGQHSVVNITPSVIIAKKLGISDDQIKKSIKTFKGLPH